MVLYPRSQDAQCPQILLQKKKKKRIRLWNIIYIVDSITTSIHNHLLQFCHSYDLLSLIIDRLSDIK